MAQNTHNTLLSVIRSGLVCIADQQLRDGSFASLSSPRPDDFSKAIKYNTTFFTSQILLCLNTLDSSRVLAGSDQRILSTIRTRAARFLISQKSQNWSFNYWSKTAKERKTRPLPDDCDDTFAALAAIAGVYPARIDGAVLACVAKLLTNTEMKAGGPYRTWFIGPKAPAAFRDVDPAVNGMVSHFLSLYDVKLENVRRYLEDIAQRGRFASPYYPGAVPVIYAIARSSDNPPGRALFKKLAALRGKHRLWSNPLETAQALSVLMRLGYISKITERDMITFATALLQAKQWKPYALCIDPSRQGQTHYAGSPAATAAFCLEACALYLSAHTLQEESDNEKHRQAGAVHAKIQSLAKDHCAELGEELKQIACSQIEKTQDEKITLLPYRFAQVLRSSDHAISDSLLEKLSLGNLWGWMAYTIYDDFLDGEGDPRLLPAANFFLRSLTHLYSEIATEIPQLRGFFDRIMNTVDNANAWEQLHCRVAVRDGVFTIPARLPSIPYKTLAERSLGHALPAVAILLKARGQKSRPRESEVESVLSFFRHYLAARQLHDDAHDWVQDLSRGQINCVGLRILKEWRRKYPNKKTIRMEKDLPALQKLFWHELAKGTVRAIRTQIAQGYAAVEHAAGFDGSKFAHELLLPFEDAARTMQKERQDILLFLKQYD